MPLGADGAVPPGTPAAWELSARTPRQHPGQQSSRASQSPAVLHPGALFSAAARGNLAIVRLVIQHGGQDVGAVRAVPVEHIYS